MVNIDICKKCQHYKKKKSKPFTMHTCALESTWHTYSTDGEENAHSKLSASYGNLVLRMEKGNEILEERAHPKDCPYALEHLV